MGRKLGGGKVDRERVRQLYASGLSSRAVGRLLDISSGYVAKFLKKEGLTRSQSDAIRAYAKQKPLKLTFHWRTNRNRARKAMQQHLGRVLGPKEHVHHINHDYTDNRLENLVVMGASEHLQFHGRLREHPIKTRSQRPSRKEYTRAYYWVRKARIKSDPVLLERHKQQRREIKKRYHQKQKLLRQQMFDKVAA